MTTCAHKNKLKASIKTTTDDPAPGAAKTNVLAMNATIKLVMMMTLIIKMLKTATSNREILKRDPAVSCKNCLKALNQTLF